MIGFGKAYGRRRLNSGVRPQRDPETLMAELISVVVAFLFFSIAPSILLGLEYGLSVGFAFFALSMILLGIYYGLEVIKLKLEHLIARRDGA